MFLFSLGLTTNQKHVLATKGNLRTAVFLDIYLSTFKIAPLFPKTRFLRSHFPYSTIPCSLFPVPRFLVPLISVSLVNVSLFLHTFQTYFLSSNFPRIDLFIPHPPAKTKFFPVSYSLLINPCSLKITRLCHS